MRIWCRFCKHTAVPSQLWNNGYYFSDCACCGTSLIREWRTWRPIPKGLKVVWKPRKKDSRERPPAFRCEERHGQVKFILAAAPAASSRPCERAPLPERTDRHPA